MKRKRIAQSEKNWKENLETYLMMYRSEPHSVTGISQAELMFGRKKRTKIPQVCDFNIDNFEVHDRDSELKKKEENTAILNAEVPNPISYLEIKFL